MKLDISIPVIAVVMDTTIYSNCNYQWCTLGDQGYNYSQQLVCGWIHLSIANAAIKDTTIHRNWHVVGYIYLQQLLRSRIQLYAATVVCMDTFFT